MGPHIHQNHTRAIVFCSLCLLGWVCSRSSMRRMAGTGGRERRAGRGGACWSWQVDSICIWHTDCTKYANRQTMTFAVLFLLVIFQSPYKVNKKVACMLLCMHLLCGCSVHTPARCVRRFKSAQWATPMNHKSHERLGLAANCSLKGIFDVWKWRWVSLKERPTGVSVPGEGKNSGISDAGCFPHC